MSATKKAKTDDFDILRQYLMNCPDVSKDSPAVQAALKGIEQEVQKRERDAKLQRKFATTTTKDTTTTAVDEINSKDVAMNDSSVTKITTTARQKVNTDDAVEEEDDWHDVSTSSSIDPGLGGSGDDNYDAESSALGVALSKVVISSIAEAQVEVETPTAAIALALHAALRSNLLGFACTGIPEDTKAGGFAPPIRELPKTQFLPSKWDQHATRRQTSSPSQVTLRYRKAGTGSVILLVTLGDDGTTEQKVRIQLIPATTITQEPPNAEGMVVALHQHINPDSFAAATSKHGKVQPALHYKRLAALLTSFLNRFDLGQVKENDATMEEVTNYLATEQQQPAVYTEVHVPNSASSINDPFGYGQNPLDPNGRDNLLRDEIHFEQRGRPFEPFHADDDSFVPSGPQMDVFYRRFPTGDFAGDLRPGGLMDPGFGAPFRPGNLMGPDHPVFQGGGVTGGGISGVGPHSGFGMKPRFDPFGPPGGPTEPFHIGDGTKNNRKIPPGGTGDPNHDHMRPPNNLNNNNNNMYG